MSNAAENAQIESKLHQAAQSGETSIVESLLTFIASSKGPAEADAAAQRAIKIAVEHKKWDTVSYLADVLADTEREPPMEGGSDDSSAEDEKDSSDILKFVAAKTEDSEDKDTGLEAITVFVCPCAKEVNAPHSD